MKSKIINIIILLVFLGIEIYNFKENYNTISFDSLRSNFWLIHMGISAIYIVISTYILKADIGYYDLILFFLPLVGAIGAGNTAVIAPSQLTPTVYDVIYNSIKNTFDEEYISVVDKNIPPESITKIESLNTIAAYDSLNVKTTEEKKKFIFEFNPPNIDFKVEILEKALKDEDINVIHYAAVELNRIDVELQKNIKEAEKTGDKYKLYQAYREYINSGILKNFMLTFYLEKTLDLLLELSGEKGELREELLTIYERLDKKDEYEKLLQNLIVESEKRELVELMLEFLYKENRYEEMLKYYKKYSNSGAVLPEIFQGEVNQ